MTQATLGGTTFRHAYTGTPDGPVPPHAPRQAALPPVNAACVLRSKIGAPPSRSASRVKVRGCASWMAWHANLHEPASLRGVRAAGSGLDRLPNNSGRRSWEIGSRGLPVMDERRRRQPARFSRPRGVPAGRLDYPAGSVESCLVRFGARNVHPFGATGDQPRRFRGSAWGFHRVARPEAGVPRTAPSWSPILTVEGG
jgi:hypothetical protein